MADEPEKKYKCYLTPEKKKQMADARRKTGLAKQKINQENFLVMFEKKALNIGAACKALGLKRQTYYLWLDDPEFAQRVQDMRENFKDWVESKIVQCLDEKDRTMLIFFAKTQMKDRGYIERHEVLTAGTLQVNGKIEVEITEVKQNESDL